MSYDEVAPWGMQNTTSEPTQGDASGEAGPTAAKKTSSSGASLRLPLLTDSRLKTYRRCPREHQYRYSEGIVPIATSDALRFGTLFHAGLEAWWKATEDRVAAAMTGVTDALAAESDPFEVVRAEELLRGYDCRWGEEQYETIAVEHEFRIPLVNPVTTALSKTWQLGGKLDVLARDDAGQLWVVEHKTSSIDIGPGSGYIARLRLDGQVSMYLRAAGELGHGEPVGVLYDVIGKVSLRPYKATPVEARKFTKDGRLYANQREVDETPEEYRLRVRESIAGDPDGYYQRATVVRLEDEVREFERELWQMGSTMRDAVRLGIAPRNPDSCQRYGSVCSFFSVCCGESSLDDERLFKRLDWPHPELTDGP